MEAQGPSALLLDHAQDKIAVFDEEGTFTHVNEVATRILGFHPGTLVGENAFAHIHPEDREEARATFERVIAEDNEVVVRDDSSPIPAYDRRVLTGDHDMDPVNHSTGCGLWLVSWIVDLSRGSITVDNLSTPRREIPRSRPRPAAPARRKRGVNPRRSPRSGPAEVPPRGPGPPRAARPRRPPRGRPAPEP